MPKKKTKLSKTPVESNSRNHTILSMFKRQSTRQQLHDKQDTPEGQGNCTPTKHSIDPSSTRENKQDSSSRSDSSTQDQVTKSPYFNRYTKTNQLRTSEDRDKGETSSVSRDISKVSKLSLKRKLETIKYEVSKRKSAGDLTSSSIEKRKTSKESSIVTGNETSQSTQSRADELKGDEPGTDEASKSSTKGKYRLSLTYKNRKHKEQKESTDKEDNRSVNEKLKEESLQSETKHYNVEQSKIDSMSESKSEPNDTVNLMDNSSDEVNNEKRIHKQSDNIRNPKSKTVLIFFFFFFYSQKTINTLVKSQYISIHLVSFSRVK